MSDILIQQLQQDWHNQFGTKSVNSELDALRHKHFSDFLAQGLPSTKDEQWKYTNLNAIKSLALRLTNKTDGQIANLQSYFLPEPHYRLVFIDGCFTQQWSLIPDNTPKFILASLHDASEKYYEHVSPYLGAIPNNAFAKLNSACLREGAFIFVPKNFVVDRPIHILNISSSQEHPHFNNLRNIIIAEPGCEVAIIEEHSSSCDNVYLTNSFTDLYANKNAKINYTKVQKQSLRSFHFGNIAVKQQADSDVALHHLNLGSQVAREDLHCHLAESGAALTIQGLYVPLKNQHIDVHSYINHAASYTTSEETYKGIVANSSRAVFNGKIYVAKKIKQVTANLQNKNLLTSKNSEVNTKPELEIYSDDVKCRHGATVGQLDRQMLFYLQSRGIALETAHQMLLSAFLHEILVKLPHQLFTDYVKNLVTHYCEEVTHEYN